MSVFHLGAIKMQFPFAALRDFCPSIDNFLELNPILSLVRVDPYL